MNKSIAVLLLSIAGMTVAAAGERHHDFFGFGGERPHEHAGDASPVNAPEIDPASAISALSLLAGGVTVMRSRFSRK